MAGFLSDSMKQICNDLISVSAETWEREIFIYRDADRAFVVRNTGEFNFLYKQQWSISQTYTPVFQSFMARTWWRQPNTEDELVDQSMRENLPQTYCRVKLRQDGYNFLSGVRSIVIDNIPTTVDFNSPRPHSMFTLSGQNPQFYDVICSKVN